ncbi:glycosyltransferase family 2 protein [Pontimicrobium sp. IMCC45349]|uniref:glycosyltransferase family 2 protein n=1 Tax=Pontimicrobium sp. IMCC45349 TaxID=3391574 RepID=UPI0039A2B7FC
MLSILIPTYNYNALPLVEAVLKQIKSEDIIFEIICRDDGSSTTMNFENEKINQLQNCSFKINQNNLGRTLNRQLLATEAKYDWLLFLDSDVIPKSDTFLSTYLKETNNNYDAIFGGFAYIKNNTDNSKSLRYTFGKHREEVAAEIRNKTPYKVIISANFLIKKDTFINLNAVDTGNSYGLDYLFGSLLKNKNIKIKHIDNEVYHLGIDTNTDYLNKTKKAVATLVNLSTDKKINKHDISLLKAFNKLKATKTVYMFRNIFSFLKPIIEKQILGKQPNLFLFDIYRLGYFCELMKTKI